MGKIRKIVITGMVILLLAVSPAFSQSLDYSLDDLKNAVENFADSMAEALPFNATMGLNWSNAYIGKVFPSMPPHFGVGISAGATFMNIGSISSLLEMFDAPSLDMLSGVGLPLPGYTIEGRVGGLFFPFDVGVKFGVIPAGSIPLLNAFDLDLDYLLVGADVRYSVLPDIIPLKVSVGLGFNYMNGGVSASVPVGTSFSFYNPLINDDSVFQITNPLLELRWETTVIELKAQASFPLLIVTPYLGLGVSYSLSNAGYRVSTSIKVDGDTITHDQMAVINEQFNMNISGENGFEYIKNVDGKINARVFGGLSFNIVVIRIDLTGMYNFMDGSYGATFGLRFQL